MSNKESWPNMDQIWVKCGSKMGQIWVNGGSPPQNGLKMGQRLAKHVKYGTDKHHFPNMCQFSAKCVSNIGQIPRLRENEE